jgi:hypothetical protein
VLSFKKLKKAENQPNKLARHKMKNFKSSFRKLGTHLSSLGCNGTAAGQQRQVSLYIIKRTAPGSINISFFKVKNIFPFSHSL